MSDLGRPVTPGDIRRAFADACCKAWGHDDLADLAEIAEALAAWCRRAAASAKSAKSATSQQCSSTAPSPGK